MERTPLLRDETIVIFEDETGVVFGEECFLIAPEALPRALNRDGTLLRVSQPRQLRSSDVLPS